jgi:hypothetical protein
MIWGWLCVCLATLAVAYSMAEMCSAYEYPDLAACSLLTLQDTLLLVDSIAGWLFWPRHVGRDP